MTQFENKTCTTFSSPLLLKLLFREFECLAAAFLMALIDGIGFLTMHYQSDKSLRRFQK
jgi:hypothetical protein